VNPAALRFARANCALNGMAAEVLESDVLSASAPRPDLVIANPPYLADRSRRVYRDGGGHLGTGLSVRIVTEALERMPSGGRLLLYTGTPVVAGAHVLRRALEPLLAGARYDYREIDPDVFGEELDEPEYGSVERIAVVGLDLVKT
jgi:hypothetical protein